MCCRLPEIISEDFFLGSLTFYLAHRRQWLYTRQSMIEVHGENSLFECRPGADGEAGEISTNPYVFVTMWVGLLWSYLVMCWRCLTNLWKYVECKKLSWEIIVVSRS